MEPMAESGTNYYRTVDTDIRSSAGSDTTVPVLSCRVSAVSRMLASRLFSRSVNAALNARLVGKCHSSRLLSSHTARPPAAAAAASSSSSSNKKTLLASTLLIGGIVGLNYHMTNNPLLYEQDEGDRIIPSDNDDIVSYVQKKVIGRVYFGTILPAYNYVKESLFGDISETLWLPSNDRLLPDIPPDASYEPPVLVLDLEKTLVGCEYDAKYGWRYAKRPGLDKFLDTVTQYFEVVIFSETDAGTVQDIVEALDKDNRIYKLYSSHAEVSKDGVIIKRLEYLNRDVSKIIVIDDNTEQYNRYPQNTLLIKPFDDLSDTADSSLLDLLPVLLAICHEDVKDVRRVLDDLGTNSVEQAAEVSNHSFSLCTPVVIDTHSHKSHHID